MAIENEALRELDSSGLARYYQRLRENGLSEAVISAHLLDAVERQSVPPLALMSVWLSFAQSPHSIYDALHQDFSMLTRKFAIKGFGRMLGHRNWEALWDTFGGTRGVLALFARLSVLEVQLLVDAIAACCKPMRDADRDAKIDELFRRLMASQNSKRRSLQAYYLRLLPCCTSKLLRNSLCIASPSYVQYDSMSAFRAHSTLLAELTIAAIFAKGDFLYCAAGLHFCLNDMQHGYPAEEGCSVAMSFALTLLRRLNLEKAAMNIENTFLPQIVEPLMMRAWNRKRAVGFKVLHEIVQLVMSYLRLHHNTAAQLSLDRGGFVFFLARCWAEQPELFKPYLVDAVKLSRGRGNNIVSRLMPVLQSVHQSCRYDLLRLLFLELASPATDINVPEDLAKLKADWTHELFLCLPRESALPLLRRLMKAKADQDFISLAGGSSIFSLPVSQSLRRGDPVLFLQFLQRGEVGASEAARDALEKQKKKAVVAREQTERAFYAKTVIIYAVASGLLDLLKDTMMWLRRYTRDALSIKTIYDESVFNAVEFTDMLCVASKAPGMGSTAELGEAISIANSIMFICFETACQALREPSFYSRDWRGPLTLFRRVIGLRLEQFDRSMQRRLDLSDEDMYDSVWESTLDLLTRVERSATESGHEGLGFSSPSGPLRYGGTHEQEIKRPAPASFRFLDNLARARDALWRDLRRLASPAVTTLSSPWPRGLPIQCLSSDFKIGDSMSRGESPFLSEHAKSIVLMDTAAALSLLPLSEEVRATIGQFVDSFRIALGLYVTEPSSVHERLKRKDLAWAHALKNLTKDRMSEREAIRYWSQVFRSALPWYQFPESPSPDECWEQQMYPTLPRHVAPEESVEWNPLSAEPSEIKSRALLPTVIDCIVANSGDRFTNATAEFSVIHPITVSYHPPRGLWNLDRFKSWRKVPMPVKEGLLVSKLLYFDSKKGGGPRLLASPFPSGEDTRCPSVFLDEEFLSRKDLGRSDSILLWQNAPPSLLAKLATATMQKLELDEIAIAQNASSKSGTVELENVAYYLISLLANSDRPQLAFDLIQTTILDRPDASSWHRRLLNATYVRRLPAIHATEFFSSFAAALVARVKIQETNKSIRKGVERSTVHNKRRSEAPIDEKITKKAAGEAAIPGVTKSFIKVTTVKYLAQLLDGADFVPEEVSIDILVQLYEEAGHIDIRVATVEAMINMLSHCKDEVAFPLAKRLINALKATIPLVSGPSERHQISEEEWAAMEDNNILPEVGNDSVGNNLSPILGLLVKTVANKGIDIECRRAIMSQILEPVVERSQLTKARWTRIFARKHQVTIKDEDLISYPIKPPLISSMLHTCLELTPMYILEMYQGFVIRSIQPSPQILAANQRILEDALLRSSDDGKHWLALYNRGPKAFHDGVFSLAGMLRSKWSPSLLERDGIELRHVQDRVFAQAKALCQVYDVHPEAWNQFIPRLSLNSLYPVDVEVRKRYRDAIGIVVERILNFIERKRGSEEWQTSQKPLVLPPTFPLRLWLLDWPHKASEAISRNFAVQIVKILDIPGGRPHHEFILLRDMLLQMPPQMRVSVARALDPQATSGGALGYACLGLQDVLITGVSTSSAEKSLVCEVDGIMQKWLGSADEEIRRRGWNLQRARG